MTINLKKVFIANRGEVCRRIASTARRLGLQTATIWTESRPAFCIANLIDTGLDFSSYEGNPYLSIEAMITAAKQSGADCIHPGFGFLSENDTFAQACLDAGLVWIGPHPAAIRAMASKSAARQLAEDSGVPVNQALQKISPKDLEKVRAFAAKVGYPVLIKAAYGGGGKGMRVVYEDSQLEEALIRCESEGKASFANGELLVEKYIEAPRHVEVQVLGDRHDQAFAIGDRDCSLQRRHQKVIEEAPAPKLHADTRQALHEAAVRLCRKVRYDNAGTVEFLLDARAPIDRLQPFYFLEMNTRLQVEHPVTEEVFGIDLVEQQFRVAAGERLDWTTDLQPRCFSVEARVYAEDPAENFLPSPGPVYRFEPGGDVGIRWEIGIDSCGLISSRFDPMIAKCIATGPSREAALDRLVQALDQTVLFGPKNNIRFIQALCLMPKFRDFAVSTHTIQEKLEELIAHQQYPAVKDYLDQIKPQLMAHTAPSKNPVADRVSLIFGQTPLSITPKAQERIEHPYDQGTVVTTSKERIVIDGSERILTTSIVQSLNQQSTWYHCQGQSLHVMMPMRDLHRFGEQSVVGLNVESPVPGKVVAIKAAAGQSVKKGTVLAILESMKMEFEIKANQDGVIAKIPVQVGEQITAGQSLVLWND